MADFRWLLLVAGILVLAVVFWISRREERGQRGIPTGFLRKNTPPQLGLEATRNTEDSGATRVESAPDRVITVRLMARGHGSFSGEDLILSLRNAGLRHGRFGIFHRHDPDDESRINFSVASLVEPGSFDLSQLKTSRFPGVSLFLALPGPTDTVAAFDDMLSTARSLAEALDGELLDEQGSHLSVQRERYLREEVIQYRRRSSPD
ncbi:MAG: cell division protein ZipA [Gammaproteobacteria bacterium]|nr:MAG: cell division protein ZipA [Gammaproteobacteria bacterium]